jgi:hypothetical protein
MKLIDLKEDNLDKPIDWNAKTIRDQLSLVRSDPWDIQLIDDPSEVVQIAAVNTDAESIQFIENPTEKVQRLAIDADPWNIDYINNPSPAILSLALKNPKVYTNQEYYDGCVKRYFADNIILMKKWIRYGQAMRSGS